MYTVFFDISCYANVGSIFATEGHEKIQVKIQRNVFKKMISANFAVAVVTVVLRGLVDRILVSMQTPVVTSSAFPSSTSTVLVSGFLFLLYNRLIRGRRIKMICSPPSSRSSKILSGRIHKNGSQSSVGSWSLRRFRSCHSRSRCRTNLLKATEDSLQMLHPDCSSSCSLCSKTTSTITKSHCTKDSSMPRSKENTPSVYSIKSDSDNLLDRMDNKSEDNGRFKGYGDCDWQDHRPKNFKRRKRLRVTRKTRSGKVYNSYL